MTRKSFLIDVREYPEYTECHIEGARLIPLEALDTTSDFVLHIVRGLEVHPRPPFGGIILSLAA